MRTTLFFTLFYCIIFSSLAQIDLGVKNLKVIQPAEYLDGENMPAGVTIEQIQFDVHNYSSTDLTMSDLSSYNVTFSYNGVSKTAVFTVVGTYPANGDRPQKMPEFIGGTNPSFLPKFPEGASSLELCVTVTANGDVDNTNDEQCITLSLGNSTYVSPTKTELSTELYVSQNELRVGNIAEQFQTISIHDVQGKTIIKQPLTDHSPIPLDDFHNGVYFVTLIPKVGNPITNKIIVN